VAEETRIVVDNRYYIPLHYIKLFTVWPKLAKNVSEITYLICVELDVKIN